ncbi:unnamed protein product [Acanthosepion pharaonis]|uniref:Uncharacterized protein n=1 Tax=Acanthosepion pharaonis TaxID=158019 RepID=A0A812EG38_ACAPH|nr:unnamed protein product [Sepia pharaonis]
MFNCIFFLFSFTLSFQYFLLVFFFLYLFFFFDFVFTFIFSLFFLSFLFIFLFILRLSFHSLYSGLANRILLFFKDVANFHFNASFHLPPLLHTFRLIVFTSFLVYVSIQFIADILFKLYSLHCSISLRQMSLFYSLLSLNLLLPAPQLFPTQPSLPSSFTVGICRQSKVVNYRIPANWYSRADRRSPGIESTRRVSRLSLHHTAQTPGPVFFSPDPFLFRYIWRQPLKFGAHSTSIARFTDSSNLLPRSQERDTAFFPPSYCQFVIK